MKILFCGSHGTGKSTLLELISPHLTMRGFEVYDSLSAKFFKPEDFKNPETMVSKQLAFTQFQCDLFSEDQIASSRSFADIWAYTKHLYMRDGVDHYYDSMQDIMQRAMDDWKIGNTTYVYFPILFNLHEVQGKELRSSNLDFQREIDENIRHFFAKTGIEPVTIETSTPEERESEIISKLSFL